MELCVYGPNDCYMKTGRHLSGLTENVKAQEAALRNSRVLHACNPSTPGAEAEGLQTRGQPGIHPLKDEGRKERKERGRGGRKRGRSREGREQFRIEWR